MSKPEEDILWAEDGPNSAPGSNEPVDPGASLRQTGYGFEQGIPHEEFNWITRAQGRWIDYLNRVRNFSSLKELIDTLPEGEYADYSQPFFRGDEVVSFLLGGSNRILDLAVDGRTVYIARGAGSTSFTIEAATYEPEESSTLSFESLGSFPRVSNGPVLISTNGGKIAAAVFDGGLSDVVTRLLDTDGTVLWTTQSTIGPATPIELHINHENVYIHLDRASVGLEDNYIIRYPIPTGDLGELIQYNNAADTLKTAVSGKYFVLINTETSPPAVSLRRQDLINGAGSVFWTIDSPAPSLSTAGTIAIDNDYVYLHGDLEDFSIIPAQDLEPAAGSTAVVYRVPFGNFAVIDADSIAVWDETRDAITIVDQEFFFIEKTIQDPGYFHRFPLEGIDTNGLAKVLSDGQHIWCLYELTSGNQALRAYSKGPKTRKWKKLDPDSPFAWPRTLAAPI